MRLLPLLFSLFVFGCKEASLPDLEIPELSGVTDINATALAFNAKGELVDFVPIPAGSDIVKIEFKAPPNGDEIQVQVIGRNVQIPELKTMVVRSQVAEWALGQVEVEVQDGIVTSVSGNGTGMANLTTMDVLKEVQAGLSSGNHQHPDSTVILRQSPAEKELVGDGQGNLVPPDLDEAGKAFLSSFMAALKTGDAEALGKFIHEGPGQEGSARIQLKFLKGYSGKEIKAYKFLRFDPSHLSYQSHVVDPVTGDKLTYGLPAQWMLEIEIESTIPNAVETIELVMGSTDGHYKVLFPTAEN